MGPARATATAAVTDSRTFVAVCPLPIRRPRHVACKVALADVLDSAASPPCGKRSASKSAQDYHATPVTLNTFSTRHLGPLSQPLFLPSTTRRQPPDRISKTFLTNPVSVTDRDMVEALELEEAGRNFETAEACEYYYCWALSADDLALVLDEWEEHGIQLPEKWDWAFNAAIGTATTASTICHIRYVGT
ncbi:hypothetical protein HDU88_007101 [Geranomyces variabilis]|nr:hypothetical protein HDU88_007101 [Geranomyces variabilis]